VKYPIWPKTKSNMVPYGRLIKAIASPDVRHVRRSNSLGSQQRRSPRDDRSYYTERYSVHSAKPAKTLLIIVRGPGFRRASRE
jgi:hypothetical protein